MMSKQSAGVPVCHMCRHYYITWDPNQPYGCRAHGFKSKQNPAQVVYESSGMVCQFYDQKPRANK